MVPKVPGDVPQPKADPPLPHRSGESGHLALFFILLVSSQ